MKRFQCAAPFSGFWGYEVWHENEGRWIVAFVHQKTGKRKTTSKARYMMAVKLGRKLKKTEHVDHIDGNKANDVIENLQILTQADNNRKSVVERGKQAKLVEISCPVCQTKFKKLASYVKFFGPLRPMTCSRRCGAIAGQMRRRASSVS